MNHKWETISSFSLSYRSVVDPNHVSQLRFVLYMNVTLDEIEDEVYES